ncbi:ribosome biogenesis GTP-binding protein YihA/YsxC [Saprospiraceae bacterium]|nr:ribosome biogenesis GTP-binding protein YihA/YsxC [Saprospiraceae bacterium]
MTVSEVYFCGSFPTFNQTPTDGKPEFAFIGRSNVGKSSLINMITNRKTLAKVSNTPGKTQLINYFMINDSWYLVDLPGYGYAKLSKTKRKEFSNMIESYLVRKNTIVCTFVLLDSRHDLQKLDLEFLNWCGTAKIPICLIFTKMDKLRPLERDKNIDRLRKSLLQYWEELPVNFISSAETAEGRDDILNYIDNLVKELTASDN